MKLSYIIAHSFAVVHCIKNTHNTDQEMGRWLKKKKNEINMLLKHDILYSYL